MEVNVPMVKLYQSKYTRNLKRSMMVEVVYMDHRECENRPLNNVIELYQRFSLPFTDHTILGKLYFINIFTSLAWHV